MKRLLLALLVVLAVASPARAENAQQVAAALRSSPVYQSQGLDLVDVGALAAELEGTDPQVDVAVLPASAAATDAEARSRAVDIGRALGDSDAVVLVITANRHLGAGNGSAAAARGVNARTALSKERAELAGFDKDGLTAFVLAFAERVADQAEDPAAPGNDGSGNGAWLLGGLVVLVAGGTTAAVVASRRRKARLNEALRADVTQLYDRLGSDVLTLDAGVDPVARQALADAAERYNACGAQLAQADAPAEFAAARRTAVEGLTAARTARTALGLDPGPPIPVVPGDGPQLAAPGQVTVDGQTYDGSPDYTPGRPHYFGGGQVGGQQVPGGWYSGNFWTPLLLGSILTSTFGGHGDGSFQEGYEAGRDDSGGDWGGGSGGDWGGGGDGGGGGDW
jgi:hypothetical protein